MASDHPTKVLVPHTRKYARIRWPKQATLNGLRVYGWTDKDRFHISVTKGNRSLSQQARTLFHELIHLALPHYDESRVLEVEHALFPIMAGNKDVFRWILKMAELDSEDE